MGALDGTFIFHESELKMLSGDQVLLLTPTTLPFFGHSLGGHEFDELWVRAVPSVLLMGPSFLRKER